MKLSFLPLLQVQRWQRDPERSECFCIEILLRVPARAGVDVGLDRKQ